MWRRWLFVLGLIVLTKADGSPIWIFDNQIVAIFSMPGVGRAPTAVVTGAGVFYVRETPFAVIRKLGWKS